MGDKPVGFANPQLTLMATSSSLSSGFSSNAGLGLSNQVSTQPAPPQDSPEVLDQKNLDSECDRIVQAIGGHILQKNSIYLGAGRYPGREIDGSISKQRKDFRTRIYYDPTNKRFFYVGVLGIDSRVNSPQASKFIESFEIVP